jgi:hypothetical protein
MPVVIQRLAILKISGAPRVGICQVAATVGISSGFLEEAHAVLSRNAARKTKVYLNELF